MTNHPRRSRRRFQIAATLADGTKRWFYKGPNKGGQGWVMGWLMFKQPAYVYHRAEGFRDLEFCRANYAAEGYTQIELEEI